jgi:hypothetical protein
LVIPTIIYLITRQKITIRINIEEYQIAGKAHRLSGICTRVKKQLRFYGILLPKAIFLPAFAKEVTVSMSESKIPRHWRGI